MKRPITPLMHGLIDYGFVTALLVMPKLLGLSKSTTRLYRVLGANLGIYNALTDHGAAIEPSIPFKTHYKIDYGNLAGLTLLTLYKGIKKDRRALAFHTAFVALAAVNVLLTDWKAEPGTRLQNS